MEPSVWTFGDYTLDGATGELRCAGIPIDIQPKAFAVLQLLIERRKSVVSKEELLSTLWPDESVSDGALKRAIHAVRSAVGDNASKQAVIRTLSRRGYRFVATLQPRTTITDPALQIGTQEEADRLNRNHAGFVGRSLHLRDLQDTWLRARSGRGALALVMGPAGIGKTRLIDEFVSQAIAEGGRLLSGWCDGSFGAPPYWPWMQVLRRLDEESAAQLATYNLDSPLAPSPVDSHDLAARSVLSRQQVIRDILLKAAESEPLILVLEDLHWADRATIGALTFLVREIADARILILSTCRDDELVPKHPLAEGLLQLTPRESDIRIHLDCLTKDEVRRMVVELSGHETDAATADAIHDRTAGIPLFVHEVVRTLLATNSLHESAKPSDGLEKFPTGAIGVLDRSLDRLPHSARTVLENAAVIGSVFDRELLQSLCREDIGFIADALASAQSIDVLRSSRDDPTHWEFSHALLREALLRSMQPSRRLGAHRDLLAELEKRHRPNPGSALTRMAEHANAIYQAGGDARTALAYDRLAAWHAAARYAFEDCVVHAARAIETLRAMEAREGVDLALSIEVRIDRARAANLQRDPETALANAEKAAKLAGESRRFDGLAQAALTTFVHPPADPALIQRNIRLIEFAEENVARESVMWVRLVSARVMQLAGVADTDERRMRDSAEALERARTLGDQDALVRALSADLTSNWSRHAPHVRLEYSRELHHGVTRMPDRFVDTVTLLTALVEQGQLEEWKELIRSMQSRISRAQAERFYAYYEPLYSATRALWRGELRSAENFMNEAHHAILNAGPLWGSRAFATQLFQLRIDQGRGCELEAGIREMHREFPTDYSFPVVLAFMMCEEGRFDEARPIFEAAADNYHVGSDVNAAVTLTVMASVCAALKDRIRAEHLYAKLRPIQEIVAVNLGCWISQGSVQWPMGLLAWTMGDPVLAERHLENAVAHNRRLGMRTYEARAALDLAQLLAEENRVERASEALAEALSLAAGIGMPRLVARGETLRSSLPGAPKGPIALQ